MAVCFRLAALLAAACFAPAASTEPVQPRHAARAAIAPVAHVAVVVMENREYDDVVGSGDAPYINALIRTSALATQFYAIRHPSLPNYLALIGGSTFGIDSNCNDCHVAGTNLIDQLESAGKSWRAYMDGAPSSCFTGEQNGAYTKHHNPFVYFDDIVRSTKRCANVVPLPALYADMLSGRLPAFVWITPDECHDMHDDACGVRAGDRFLARLLRRLLPALGRDGVLFLTWDEGSSDAGCCAKAAGGHIATIVAGGLARPGARSALRYDHYSILRTIEDVWALPRLGDAACSCTRSLAALLRRR